MKLPISLHQIWAFAVRSSLVNRRNVFAAFEMLFWPAIGIFSVGLLTRFLNLTEEKVTFILIGALAMNTVQIAQLDLSYALLYSVWSKSLKHEFIAPIRLGHILLGAGLMGLVRGFLVFLLMAVLSVGLFHMELSRPGPGAWPSSWRGCSSTPPLSGPWSWPWCCASANGPRWRPGPFPT